MLSGVEPEQTKDPVQAISVSVLGVDERTRRALSLAFENRAKGLFEVSSTDYAEVVVIDIDSEEGALIWERYQQHPTPQPVILISTQPPLIKDVCRIKKPMEFSVLLEALFEVTGDWASAV